MSTDWLDEIKWTVSPGESSGCSGDGLVPVITQEQSTGKVLMFAWMNREALALTVKNGIAVYWSRSRQRLWRKGEESGHTQIVKELRLDCDNDVILMVVEQRAGIACHTGRHSCFYRQLEGERWAVVEPVIKDPGQIYKGS